MLVLNVLNDIRSDMKSVKFSLSLKVQGVVTSIPSVDTLASEIKTFDRENDALIVSYLLLLYNGQ